MKVLVTGITGFLGGHVAQVLLQRGYVVRGLYRTLSAPMRQLPWYEQIEWIQGDLLHLPDLQHAAEGCQALIHVAARTDQYPSDLLSYSQPNILATVLIAEVAMRQNMRLVFVSTANVFGTGGQYALGTEQHPFQWADIGSGYATSKYLAQKQVLEYTSRGLDAVVVNPTFMIGGHDFKPSSGAMIQHVLRRRVVFYPKNSGKNFIYVKDAAVGVVNALERGEVGEAYLLAHQNLSYGDFMRKVAHIAHRRRFFVPIPAQVLRVVGLIVSWLRLPYALNFANATLLTTYNYYTADKAIRCLRLPQTAIEIAIQEAVEWFDD